MTNPSISLPVIPISSGGNYRANPAHPPLAKVWAALPLLAIDIKDPRPGNTIGS